MSVRRGLCLAPLLLALLAAGCGVLPLSQTAVPEDGELVVSFIDVGQGDATLVQYGAESYLIDAGRPEEGSEVVGFLRSRGVEELDGVVATHPDSDHIGGLTDVFDAFEVRRFYMSGRLGESTIESALAGRVREEGAEVARVRSGVDLGWGSAPLEAEVISPPSPRYFGSDNDGSVALLLRLGEGSVLLPGDVEEEAEEYMTTIPFTGNLTVLKVAHHGSTTSTTPLFLNRFRPRVAVISAGEDNDYGHPDPRIIERLEEIGARTFRTDRQGDVIVTLDRRTVEVAVTE